MKKWLVLVAACLLAACSTTENKTYYQLPIATGTVQNGASTSQRMLWIEQVSIPDFLAGSGWSTRPATFST